jgi:predicted nucleotidyltransferase
MIDLQELLQVRVDVATVAGLKSRIREKILKEAVVL